MGYVIQVIDGDTETHYSNPVLHTFVYSEPEEAYRAFYAMTNEFKVFVWLKTGKDVEWRISHDNSMIEYRSKSPIEVIFTISHPGSGGEQRDIKEVLGRFENWFK